MISEGVKNSANGSRLTGSLLAFVARVIRPVHFTSADLPLIHRIALRDRKNAHELTIALNARV
jgi:hypothetical protein